MENSILYFQFELKRWENYFFQRSSLQAFRSEQFKMSPAYGERQSTLISGINLKLAELACEKNIAGSITRGSYMPFLN